MGTSKFNVEVVKCGDNDALRIDLKEDVDSEDWLILFNEIFCHYKKREFKFLIDSRFYSDNVGIEGFMGLWELCVKYGVGELIIGVLTSENRLEIIKEMFLEVGGLPH